MAAYSVPIAELTIPGSTTRLKKSGYCGVLVMADVWQFTQTLPADEVQKHQQDSQITGTEIPVLFVQRIGDLNDG